MKKLHLPFLLFLVLSFYLTQNIQAQISGIKTIPGNYTTISAAIADLNGNGVGTGGVIYNIAAGYTETITATLSLTATGTAANPIIFQKSGIGANPKITAYSGGTATPSSSIQDGIWRFIGSDYVTIDGIDLYDPNTTNPATMEYGFGLFCVTSTNGCQHDTIKNCVISLSRNNNVTGNLFGGSLGIYVMNALANSQTTELTPTSSSGTNSYNSFNNNTIKNCNMGIAMNGYNTSSTTLVATNNNISNNIIVNFGSSSGSTQSAGIYVLNQSHINILYNTINSNDGSGEKSSFSIWGIYVSDGDNSTISYNIVSLKFERNASGDLFVEVITSTCENNSIISNNEVSFCTLKAYDGVYFTGISGQGNCSIYNNKIINNKLTSIYNTAYSHYYFYGIGIGANFSTTSYDFCYNNLIANDTIFSNNKGQNVIYGISTGGKTTSKYCFNNEINNLSILGNAIGISEISGIFAYATTVSSSTSKVYRNKIYNLSSNKDTIAINGIKTNGNSYTTFNLYNNIIGNLQAPFSNSDNSIIGINNNGAKTNAFYNTIYLNATSAGALFGSTAFYATTNRNVTLNNNIFVNTSTPKGVGITAAYRRSSVTLSSYVNSSNNNFLYAGTPSANNLIYYDGTFTAQSLYMYKTLVAPCDSVSITSATIPNFISTTSSDSLYLHINTNIPSVIESGGKIISGYDDDFDGNIRFGSIGYNGNGTAPDIGADEFNSISIIPVNIGNDTTLCNGSTLSLNAGYPGATYIWSTGATSQNINVTNPGTYSVIVNNGPFQTGYDTINVYFASSVPVSVNITKSADSVCFGNSVTYTAAVTNGGSSPVYQWKVNGVNMGTNNSIFTYSPANNDSVKCIVTSNLTTCTSNNPATSNIVNMFVYPILQAGVSIIASQNPVCLGSNVTFTANPVNGGNSPTYIWMKNGIVINGENNATYSSSSLLSGDTISCVMTSNATPCLSGSPTTSNSITMTVNQYLPVSVTITANPTGTICQGTNITFTATPVNGGLPAYIWLKNGTIINGQTNVSYSSSTLSNNDTIKCIMTSSLGCTNGNPSFSNTIVSSVSYLPSNAGIITGNTSVCQGQNAVTYTVPSISNATTYIWTLPIGATGTSNTNSITVNYSSSATSGNITVKGNNICGDGISSSIPIIVKQIPATPVITQNGNTLSSNISTGNQWYNLSSGLINNATSQTYNPVQIGNYFTIVTQNGCSSDSSNIIYYDNTGIKENNLSADGFYIYPNPAKENMIIELTENKISQNSIISIYNIQGQLFKLLLTKQTKTEIDILDFPAGVYIIKVNNDKKTLQGKFVKE